MSEFDHAADSMAYAIMAGIGDLVPSRRKLLDWLVPPTAYCFMLLFATLIIFEVLSKIIDGMTTLTQGILIQ